MVGYPIKKKKNKKKNPKKKKNSLKKILVRHFGHLLIWDPILKVWDIEILALFNWLVPPIMYDRIYNLIFVIH